MDNTRQLNLERLVRPDIDDHWMNAERTPSPEVAAGPVKKTVKIVDPGSDGEELINSNNDKQPSPAMALIADISKAVACAAEKELAKALCNLLSKVAEDYELDFEEMKAKYLGDKAPKARKVKAKVTKVVEPSSDEESGPPRCIGITKKGERCKCRPRNGEVTCGRHKDFDPDEEIEEKPAPKKRGRKPKPKMVEDSESEEEVKAAKKKKATKKKVEPVHKHDLEEADSDCEECQQQGGPFVLREASGDYEVPNRNAVEQALEDILAGDSSSEEEEELMPRRSERINKKAKEESDMDEE
jgi:hypothetical protein